NLSQRKAAEASRRSTVTARGVSLRRTAHSSAAARVATPMVAAARSLTRNREGNPPAGPVKRSVPSRAASPSRALQSAPVSDVSTDDIGLPNEARHSQAGFPLCYLAEKCVDARPL